MLMNLYIWGTGRKASIALGTIIEEDKVTGFIDNDDSKKFLERKRFFSKRI